MTVLFLSCVLFAYSSFHSLFPLSLFASVSGSTTNTTNTTVQPLVRVNNNMRQPATAQRQHCSPAVSSSSTSAITGTTYRELRPTVDTKMNIIESSRYEYTFLNLKSALLND
jgi:hypothetical protein